MELIPVSGGVRIAIHALGEGPPIVLVPGFGLDHTVWDHQVRVLTAAGFRVICVDPRGHGRSDKPIDGYGIEQLSKDLLDVLDHLDLDDVILVGHSFAGQVGFHAAALDSARIGGLVLVGSNAVRASRSADFPFGAPAVDVLPSLLDGEDTDRLASRRRNLASAFAYPPSELVVEWLMQVSLQMPSWAALACYRSMLESDLTTEITRVTMPVLQVVGSMDPVHSARGAAWLVERLSNSRLIRIDGCGHYPMLESADVFERELLAFAATVVRDRSALK
ncbi:alpha/beta hydrolase [Rhodococcus rhodochrous]|nr:alpha/beta hydrolase [Rhodococcus rhodochrous]